MNPRNKSLQVKQPNIEYGSNENAPVGSDQSDAIGFKATVGKSGSVHSMDLASLKTSQYGEHHTPETL